MGKRTKREVIEYVEWQSNNECEVISAKPEQVFNDLGYEVQVWNVKTDTDGAWWVVEGDEIPMNLYPQDAYYFGTDEVYSFHIGIIERMNVNSYKPEDYVNAMTNEMDTVPHLFRKLNKIALLIDSAIEIEDFQAIGVQCREVLIELGNHIYFEGMTEKDEQPHASDFKKKAEYFIKYYLVGSGNKDYRKIVKNITESTWEYANKITHSRSTTFYEASSCVSLCTSLVGIYHNVNLKISDPISRYVCSNCTSKKLNIVNEVYDSDGIISHLDLQCEECNAITKVEFDELHFGRIRYIKNDIE